LAQNYLKSFEFNAQIRIMGHVAPIYNVYICLTVIHSNNIVVCRSNSFRFVWFGFVGKFVHCLAEIIIECHLNDKLGSWKGGK